MALYEPPFYFKGPGVDSLMARYKAKLQAGDADGAIVGGLLGHLYWGWLSVETLWVDERYRGQGLGGRLLDMAEAEARQHGCAHVQLDTLTFQARPFYEARGYRVYGELADFPAGTEYRRFYLTKQL